MRQSKKHPIRPFSPIVWVILIIASSLLTCATFILVQQRVKVHASQSFDELTSAHVQQLSQQINACGDLLYATRGLFAATGVNAQNWESFVQAQSTSGRYPGMKAFAYADVVPRQNIPVYLEQLKRENHNQKLTIHPGATANKNVILRYHKELTSTSLKKEQALGFVLSSDRKRLSALTRAEQTGNIAATAPINLVTNGQPGFLLVLPILERSIQDDSPREVLGYSVAAFEVGPMIDKTIGKSLEQYRTSLVITDVTEEASRLYTSSVQPAPGSLSRNIVITVADRQWKLTFQTPSQNLVTSNDRYSPYVALAIGATLTLTMCVLIYNSALRKQLSRANHP